MTQHNLTTAEVLDRAADDLERWGWGTKWFPKLGDPACAEGAIKRVCQTSDAYRAAKRTFAAHVGEYGWVWNDRPGRTATEVIEALRACAVIQAAHETSAVAETHTPAGLPGESVSA